MKVLAPILKRCLLFVLLLSAAHLNAQLVDSLEAELKKCTDQKKRTDLLNELSWQYSYTDTKKAVRYAEDAGKLSASLNYAVGKETSIKHLAQAYMMMGNYPEAEKLDKKLIAIHEKNNNVVELGKIHNNISVIYNRVGKYGEAMNHMLLSKKYFELLHDTDRISMMYVAIGNCYNRLHNEKSALECFLKAVNLKPHGKDANDIIASAYVALGITYLNMKEFSQASDYFKLAEKLYTQTTKDNSMDFKLADLYSNIASVYMDASENETAKKYLNSAFDTYNRMDDPEGKATVIISLASIEFNQAFELQGKPQQQTPFLLKALALFDSSQAITKRRGLRNLESETYKRKSDALYLLKRNDSALWYYHKHIVLRDSLQSIELELKINEMNLEYETEKKEKEIAILEKNNIEVNALAQSRKTTIILVISVTVVLILILVILFLRDKSHKRQQEVEFAMKKTELEQKALRAQMNPHFLFNSLNSIQRMFIEGKTDIANEVMADFSSLLRRILNNSAKSKISLKEEIDTLELYLDIEKIRCDNCFSYIIELDDNIDRFSCFVPPLVIQPFVENAIWHGVLPIKQEGVITISIMYGQDPETLLCTVEDNGKGIDVNKMGSQDSKGIQITEQRLGTKVVFERPEKGGTRVKIIIPLIS